MAEKSRRPKNVRKTCLPGCGIPKICDRCRKPLPKRRQRWCSDKCGKEYLYNHSFSFAKRAVKRRDKYKCVLCGKKGKVEVDHIERAMGTHSLHSCKHHQTNLRCLCHECHLKVTREQMRKKDE